MRVIMRQLLSVIYLFSYFSELRTTAFKNLEIDVIKATPSQPLVHHEFSKMNFNNIYNVTIEKLGIPQLNDHQSSYRKGKTAQGSNMKVNAFVTPTTRTDCFNSVVNLTSQSAITNGIDGSLSYMSIGANNSMVSYISYASGTYASFFFQHAWLYGPTCNGCKIQFYFGSKGVSSIESCYDLTQFSRLGSAGWYVDWTYNTNVQPGCTLFYATYDTALGKCGVLTQTGLDGAAVVGAVWGDGTLPPTNTPTVTPTVRPASPTAIPTRTPTFVPSVSPTFTPTVQPSVTPSVAPSYPPTQVPTHTPSFNPSVKPSLMPSSIPTYTQTITPTNAPITTTASPTPIPSTVPSSFPTLSPSHSPSIAPSQTPSATPTLLVPTKTPNYLPSIKPSSGPTNTPSNIPSSSPTRTASPVRNPLLTPSEIPTHQPSSAFLPPSTPSLIPSVLPSYNPSVFPVDNPSKTPSLPSSSSSSPPSYTPSVSPSYIPSYSSSILPTHYPTIYPTISILSSTLLPTTESMTNSPSFEPTGPTLSPTIAGNASSKSVQSNSSNVMLGVGAGAAIAGACCCIILLLFYRKKMKNAEAEEPVGTQDLKSWIRQDEESSNTIGSVKLANWKQTQLAAIGGALYLSPRPGGNTSSYNNTPATATAATAVSSEGRNRSGSPMKQSIMPVQEAETLHSIQQQLHSLSGVNPLSVQSTQPGGGGCMSEENFQQHSLRHKSNTIDSVSSSPPRSPLRSSVFGMSINTSHSNQSSPGRSTRNPIHSSSGYPTNYSSSNSNNNNNEAASSKTSSSSSSFISLKDKMMTSIRSSTMGVMSSPNKAMVDDNSQHSHNRHSTDGNDGDDVASNRPPSFSWDIGSVYKHENPNSDDI